MHSYCIVTLVPDVGDNHVMLPYHYCMVTTCLQFLRVGDGYPVITGWLLIAGSGARLSTNLQPARVGAGLL
jgi:hypothetical protein